MEKLAKQQRGVGPVRFPEDLYGPPVEEEEEEEEEEFQAFFDGAMSSRAGGRDGKPRFLPAFGQRLRMLRMERGLTQQELGERAGMDRTFVGLLERGQRGCNIERLESLASALGVQPADLLPDQRHERG